MGDIDFAKWSVATRPAGFSAEELRFALSKYATGVAIVTTVDEEQRPFGLAVNSFTSVSLEPPLVLWCLRRASSLFGKFEPSPTFGINVLAAHQADLAARFSAKIEDRFAGVAYDSGVLGCPILPGAAATLECQTVAQYLAGDHLIFLGEVRSCSHSGAAPLIFHSKNYWTSGLAMAGDGSPAADVVRPRSVAG